MKGIKFILGFAVLGAIFSANVSASMQDRYFVVDITNNLDAEVTLSSAGSADRKIKPKDAISVNMYLGKMISLKWGGVLGIGRNTAKITASKYPVRSAEIIIGKNGVESRGFAPDGYKFEQ
jgi:hypothetical protein